METSILAIRVVGLVIIGPCLTTTVGEHGLIIIAKPVVTRAGDVEGAKPGSLVVTSCIPGCSMIDTAGGTDVAS